MVWTCPDWKVADSTILLSSKPPDSIHKMSDLTLQNMVVAGTLLPLSATLFVLFDFGVSTH